MNNLAWVYPTSVDELVDCLKEGARPVGGGTGLMRNAPKSGTLADLSGVGISEITIRDGVATIGGYATYAEVIREIGAFKPNTILARALSTSASPALRNSITVGGSLGLFPPWSRLVGPLVALNGSVDLVGANAGRYSVAEYAERADLKEAAAVVSVTVDLNRDWETHWFAFSPVRFNYPLFTVAVILESRANSINDCRIVVTGNSGRFARLETLEDAARGADRSTVAMPEDLGAKILGRQGFSSEYLTHLAGVMISRALRGSKRSAA